MYRLHGAIHAYGGTVSARDTADSVITALSPAAWYRNATGVTSAGGFASQWDDYSGNARHLVQATGTNQPAYAAGVLTFDGADNLMVASSWSQTQPVTIVAVLNQVSWDGGNGDRAFDGTLTNSATVQQTGVTPNIRFYAGTGSAESSALTVGAFGIVCVVGDGAGGVFRVNNEADIAGNFGAAAPGGFTLGCPGGSGFSWGNFQFKEVVIFPSALSDANRTSVITALNNALTVF